MRLELDTAWFRHARDPRPVVRRIEWPRLAVGLRRFRPMQGSKAERLATCPLWSPVRLRPGGRRRLADVLEVTALVLDYDGGTTVDEALDQWAGFERVAHTTWSHRAEAPRCRVILPLVAPIPSDGWSELYKARIEEADRQCCDPSRAYFLPAIGAGGPHEARFEPGEVLDLRDEHAHILAERERAKVKRAERARARRRQWATSPEAVEREVRRRLRTDPEARRIQAERLGAQVITRPSGEVARRIPCPSCGRPSCYFYLDPHRARRAVCEHMNSCGWRGHLEELGAP